MLLFMNFPFSVLIVILLLLFFGMGLHEYGHALMADWWGDPTPRRNRKLTPNPLAHFDAQGWIWILLIGFGTAGSVMINPRLMRDSRWGSFWTSLAGPLMNLLQAIIFALFYRFLANQEAAFLILGGIEAWQLGNINVFVAFFSLITFMGVWLNLLLFVFNLLPLFPLDGYRVILALLPGTFLSPKQIPAVVQQTVPPLSRFLQQPAFVWQDWQMLTYYIFIGLIMLSFAARLTGLWFLNIFSLVMDGPVFFLLRFLIGF